MVWATAVVYRIVLVRLSESIGSFVNSLTVTQYNIDAVETKQPRRECSHTVYLCIRIHTL